MTITDWFKEMDYNTGVDLYVNHPSSKSRNIASLKKGKSNRNFSLLVSELRRLNNTTSRVKISQTKKQVVTSINKKGSVIEKGQKESEIQLLKQKSSDRYFKPIRYGELPSDLKLRFRELKDIFYDLCDLKLALNDVPDENEEEALEIQIKIEELDVERAVIWKELEHWQTYKTKLPSKPTNDFSGLSSLELDRKRRNLLSSISKKQKRIERWKSGLEKQSTSDQKKTNQQINRTAQAIHQHEIDIQKIQEFL